MSRLKSGTTVVKSGTNELLEGFVDHQDFEFSVVLYWDKLWKSVEE